MADLSIKPFTDEDRAWARDLSCKYWGSEKVIAHGAVFFPAELDGFVAWFGNARAGLATYDIKEKICEIVTLNSLQRGLGIGSRLVAAVKAFAIEQGCTLLMLITTNDNTSALRFYQKQGFRMAALRPGAVDEARKLKPEIPLAGEDGIPIRDEIEMEMDL